MLNLNAITVRLGGRLILDGAKAALPPGSRVGLVGRNGAGKTTLVRVVAGSLEPDSGGAEMPKGTRLGYIAQEARVLHPFGLTRHSPSFLMLGSPKNSSNPPKIVVLIFSGRVTFMQSGNKTLLTIA